MDKATLYDPANKPGPDLAIRELRNAVITKSMLVVTARGVHPACLHNNLPLKKRLQLNLVGFGSLANNRLHRLEDRADYFFVFNPWGTGYYHWLTEVVVKFLIFESELRNGTILVPETCPKFVTEFLSLMGFSNVRYLQGNTFVKRLKVITNPATNHYHPKHLKMLQDRMWELPNINRESQTRRLYISRKYARARKVINEVEVIETLSGFGFECVCLEQLAFPEQVALFGASSFVVSIHGAGLAHLIFAPHGTNVIELYPRASQAGTQPVVCFRRLCDVLGQQHSFLFCEREFPGSRFNLDVDNILVDIKEMEDVVAARLSESKVNCVN